MEENEAKVSVFDHGLLYGDGVFEGIRLYGGKIFRLEQHLDRLNASARAIMLQVPMTKAALTEACCETCRQNKLTDGYLRLVVTRGVVMELAPVTEKNLTRYDLMTADECFLTGTAAEIVPVASLDGRPIGSGKPGAVSLKLTEEFRKLTRAEGTPIHAV